MAPVVRPAATLMPRPTSPTWSLPTCGQWMDCHVEWEGEGWLAGAGAATLMSSPPASTIQLGCLAATRHGIVNGPPQRPTTQAGLWHRHLPTAGLLGYSATRHCIADWLIEPDAQPAVHHLSLQACDRGRCARGVGGRE